MALQTKKVGNHWCKCCCLFKTISHSSCFFSLNPTPTRTPQKSLRICENLMGAFFESGWVWTHPNPPMTPPLRGWVALAMHTANNSFSARWRPIKMNLVDVTEGWLSTCTMPPPISTYAYPIFLYFCWITWLHGRDAPDVFIWRRSGR